jgi:hypothetical protein
MIVCSPKSPPFADNGTNAESSRSHSILRLQLKSQSSGRVVVGTLNLVDLAGSETHRPEYIVIKSNQDKTQTMEARKAECKAINQSLLSLGNVINDLAKGLPVTPRLGVSFHCSCCCSLLCVRSCRRTTAHQT